MARDSCNLKSSFKSVSSSSDESDTSDHSKRNGGLRRNVSFSSLEIRSYNITLGDAPTPNAISLDWEYDPSATEEHQVDHYEHHRNENAPRRNKQEMIMPPSHRRDLLMSDAGFSIRDIQRATHQAVLCAKQREKTAKSVKLGLQPVEEVLEVLGKTKRRFSFGKSKHR
mmetsp:Transcript_23805/g.49815  ORF Transcript_23805/g.49815 Transcript_23805/m.49815 type:complete len:169 (+) Transcript_23805:227-733(+)